MREAGGVQSPAGCGGKGGAQEGDEKRSPCSIIWRELQNDCSRLYKISPDQTLSVVQELYEKKLVTYPRTDARVLSSAVAKEIQKNIRGAFRLFPGGALCCGDSGKGQLPGHREKSRYYQ